MTPARAKFHLTLLRLAKGALAAYEEWLVADAGVTLQRGSMDYLRHAEIVAAAQVITAAVHARQDRERQQAAAHEAEAIS